jgi:hypothetical protein
LCLPGSKKCSWNWANPVNAGEFTAPQPMDEEALKKFIAIAEKHGQKLYPPDYLG